MSLLLDTHVLLWVLTNDPTLTEPARPRHLRLAQPGPRERGHCVGDHDQEGVGQLHAPNDLVQQLATRRIASLDVTIEHALAVSDLAEYHTDPFDRLLVAQARAERLTLVTRDRNSARYDVDILAA